MWIDTHCHLDAPEFAGHESRIVSEAEKLGIGQIVIPAVKSMNFEQVAALAHTCDNCSYALGIHPMYVASSPENDLLILDKALEKGMSDSRLVAIGEIGLDFYFPDLAQSPIREKQEYFLSEQLKMARKYGLPVLLHTRRSVDTVLKHLRRHNVHMGIAHAFNGSFQQAEAFIDQGIKISFCGTVTYKRAHQLRKLAAALPIDAMVVETDSPDLPPAWKNKKENSPLELPRIGELIAGLRDTSPEELAMQTSCNALSAIPRLVSLPENNKKQQIKFHF